MSPTIFVINLDRDSDRLARIGARLRSMGLEFIRVPGVLGASLSREELARVRPAPHYWVHRRPFTLGEVGCALSHQAALAAIAGGAAETGLVLEDDAVFAPDFLDVFRALPELGRRFDIVKLEGMPRDGVYPQRRLGALGRRNLVYPHHPAVGAAGYVVSRKAAARLAGAAAPVREPFDWVLVNHTRLSLSYVEIHPYPVAQETADTEMRAARQSVVYSKPTALYRLRRNARRIAEQGRRLAHEMKAFGPSILWTPTEKSRRGLVPPSVWD